MPLVLRRFARARRFVLTVLVATIALPALAWAAGWELIDEERGIRAYRRDVRGSDIVAFRGEATVEAPLGKVLAVLVDNEHRTDWVDRLKKSVVLERVSAYEYIIYQHFGLPILMSDRDYVYRGRAVTDGKTGQVTLHLQSIDHPKAPKTVGVRGELVASRYVLTPGMDGKSTRVEVEIHTDPKGALPAWLVNLVQKSWPMKTLRALREQVKKPYVNSVSPPPAA